MKRVTPRLERADETCGNEEEGQQTTCVSMSDQGVWKGQDSRKEMVNQNGGEGEAKERKRHQKLTPIGDVMEEYLFAYLLVCLFACLLACHSLKTQRRGNVRQATPEDNKSDVTLTDRLEVG